jgi:hypothetical protein
MDADSGCRTFGRRSGRQWRVPEAKAIFFRTEKVSKKVQGTKIFFSSSLYCLFASANTVNKLCSTRTEGRKKT